MRGPFSLLHRKLFLSVVSAGCALVLMGGQALAQVEGCNPRVLDAMQKTAQGRVAAKKAATAAVTPQPNNPMAVGCANQAFGVSASRGGAIFSGDFMADVAPMFNEVFQGLYNNYANSDGVLGNIVAAGGNQMYSPATQQLQNTYNCDGIANQWNYAKDNGIKQGIPKILFSNLVSGNLPAGTIDPDFQQMWQAARNAQSLFNDINVAIGNLPAVNAIPPPPPANAGACQVLMSFGVVPSCP